MGMVEGWKGIGGRKRGSFRRSGVHHNGNDDEWDGSENEREREQAGKLLKKVRLVLG